MQGATVEWAGVIGTPEDFTRNWSYTALSRAREPTEVRVVTADSARDRERAEIAPAERFARSEPLEHLERSMRTADEQGLARDYFEPALLSPRDHVTEVLGRRPTDTRGRAAWERGVRAIEGYRFDHDVRDRDALGPKPREVQARDAWIAARRTADDARRQLGRQVERGIEWVR
jgi:hypothetical protein